MGFKEDKCPACEEDIESFNWIYCPYCGVKL